MAAIPRFWWWSPQLLSQPLLKRSDVKLRSNCFRMQSEVVRYLGLPFLNLTTKTLMYGTGEMVISVCNLKTTHVTTLHSLLMISALIIPDKRCNYRMDLHSVDSRPVCGRSPRNLRNSHMNSIIDFLHAVQVCRIS
jgi:hypothetical protein